MGRRRHWREKPAKKTTRDLMKSLGDPGRKVNLLATTSKKKSHYSENLYK